MGNCPQCDNKIKDELYCPKCKAPIEENISKKISGYLFYMANNFYLTRAYKEAEVYAEKLVKNAPKNSQAWLLKGNIQAYSSPGDDLSYGKSIKAWTNAISFAKDGGEISQIKETISSEMFNGFAYSSYIKAVEFSRNPNRINAISLENCKKYLSLCDLLDYKVGVDLSEDKLSDFLANQMIGAAVRGSEQANQKYGKTPEEQTPEKYMTWLASTDTCIEMLEKASELATKTSTVEACYSRASALQQKMIESKSYKLSDKPKTPPTPIGLRDDVVREKKKKISSYEKMKAKQIKELQKKKKSKK